MSTTDELRTALAGMTEYYITIGAPRWFGCKGFGWLTWLARASGFAHRWEAKGTTARELYYDLRRLAKLHGLQVKGEL